jgi:hypothetical protein
MIPGIQIEFGGRALILAPMNFATLEVMQERLTAWKGGMDVESRTTVVDCVLASLQRNHPDVTREFVQQYLDVANMVELMSMVMDVGGLKRKEIEAGKASAVKANGSIGATSTATS